MAESNSKLLYDFYKRGGICVRCGQEDAVKGKTRCVVCLEKDAEAQRRCRENRTEEEILEERNRMKEYSRKRYYELKAKGKCISCGKSKTVEGRVYCNKCNTKNNRRKKIAYKNRPKIYKRYEKVVIPQYLRGKMQNAEQGNISWLY